MTGLILKTTKYIPSFGKRRMTHGAFGQLFWLCPLYSVRVTSKSELPCYPARRPVSPSVLLAKTHALVGYKMARFLAHWHSYSSERITVQWL